MLSYKFRITNVRKNRALMLVIYVLLSLATTAAITLVASAILMSGDDPIENIPIGAFLSLIISAAISGFGISKLAGGDPKASMISHLTAAIMMLILGLIFGGGASGIMNAICYLGVAALFSLLGKRKKRRPRRIKN